MKIFSAEIIRNWDRYTILHEPIASIDLMKRAAGACMNWLERQDYLGRRIHIFCGKGNNGGDGLAIAHLLATRDVNVAVHILEFGHLGTDDFQVNLARLHQVTNVSIGFIQLPEHFHSIAESDLVIDALIGSGLNRPLDGLTAKLVQHINASKATTVAIDMPSGIFADASSVDAIAINASYTLTFQCIKLGLLAAENSSHVGKVAILDIGLSREFYNITPSSLEYIDEALIRDIYKPRNDFSHKGDFGHALIVAGSYGKIGAALLSASACLRAGAGLVTCHVPACGYDIMQTALPEAMLITDVNHSFISNVDTDLSKFKAIGVGPGIGTAMETKAALHKLILDGGSSLVLDADALNGLAGEARSIPRGSVITPHPKEFERLFGKTANEFDRNALAMSKAKELNIFIVLKGHHSMIATPGGKAYFNATGNAGMATAGSGDVLTGIITALRTQGYDAANAAIFGVYLHGLAGDVAAADLSMEAMIAGDIVARLGHAFRKIAR